jgi:hypothetical protein
MHRKLLATLAVSCALSLVTSAQQPSPAPGPPRHSKGGPAQTEAAANPTAVGMDEAVITLKGACQPSGGLQPAKDCVSTITREQFEKLANALQPEMAAEAKRNFALNYARLLVFSDAARALQLENDPNVQLLLHFVTQQVLADGVRRHYTEEFAHLSDQKVQAYYDQNSAKYLEVTLQRIVIPRNPVADDKPKPNESEWMAAAEKLRQQWVAGGDPVKLQQAAYEAAGITGAGTPDVSLGARRTGSLPADQESVFQLKAGDISQVFTDQAAGYIYKVASARQIPLSEEKASIIKVLQRQELQDKLEEISKSATPELNEQYFGPPPAAAAPGMPPHSGATGSPSPNPPPK